MSQRSEKITRRVGNAESHIDFLSTRISQLENDLANLAVYRDADTKRRMGQGNDLLRLKREMYELRRTCILQGIIVVSLIGLVTAGLFSVRAEVRAMDKPSEPVQTVEAVLSQAVPPAEPLLNTIENARITYYCGCTKCCGKSDGVTSSGAIAQAGVTVSTDPAVIPTGSRVKIGDSWYIAQDTGVTGAVVDVFVEGHQEALELGVRTETVYWEEG